MMKNLHKKALQKSAQLGIAENENYRCMVLQQGGEITDIHWHTIPRALQESLQTVSFSQKFTIIRPLPYQYIWRRTLFLPLYTSHQDIYKQVIYLLKQQVPLPIQQLNFDYYWEEQFDSKRLKLVIYAIRKEYINTFLIPKQRVYLDCELHCYLRAFNYLLPESKDTLSENSYKIGDVSFQFKNEELIVEPQQSSYQYHIEQLHLADDILDKHLYLQALGASLWNGKE